MPTIKTAYIPLNILKNDKVCASCIHFHFRNLKGMYGYNLSHKGHCSHPRIKSRAVTQTCPHFKDGEDV